MRLRDLNSFALAAYRGIPTSISIATTLRRGSYLPTTQDSLPATGPALPDGIGYPQGSLGKRFPSLGYPPFLSFLGAMYDYVYDQLHLRCFVMAWDGFLIPL